MKNCICYISDNNYAEYTATSLFSLVRSNPDYSDDIIIVSLSECPISDENKHLMQSIYSKVIFKEIDLNTLPEYKSILDHFSDKIKVKGWKTCICKLYLMFELNYENILFLDSDTLVVNSISVLFKFKKYDIMLCVNGYIVKDQMHMLKYNPDEIYNGGVFVISNDFKQYKDRYLNYANNFEFGLYAKDNELMSGAYFDQDILNGFLRYELTPEEQQRVFNLPYIYNTWSCCFDPISFKPPRRMITEEKIIHFVNKPLTDERYANIDEVWQWHFNEAKNKYKNI